MDINILKNILIIFIIIILFLVLSNDKQYNTIINKNKINYLILLVLIYFIYAGLPISIILIVLLTTLLLNKDFYRKYIVENKYLKEYIPNLENFDNNSKLENFDFTPYNEGDTVKSVINEDSQDDTINIQTNNQLTNQVNIQTNNNIENNKSSSIEPFKSKIKDIREHINNAINNKT